jgi:60 kDa SS-A/Ro ribonucleoprotein
MANRTLFRSLVGRLIPAADARNRERAPAYRFPPRHALAQLAATGCLNTTFYADAEHQLRRVLDLAERVTPEFVAKTAVYCRERANMKDMPALLLAALSRREPALMDRVFDRVIDSPRMLRTFVQIVRSGAVGRKSLGSAPKRCVRRWLETRSDEAIFAASVGNAPSLADVVRMVHPKPATRSREALYAYLLNRSASSEALPPLVRQYEAFKRGERGHVPEVPFQMLASLALDRREWAAVVRNASWQTLRMNVNTVARHGVFDEPAMAEHVAARLRDVSALSRARVFPYQLLAAARSLDATVPAVVRAALDDAMEVATVSVPTIGGLVYLCPDVSGSMRSPITGARKGATTTVRCVDVAALITAAIVRRNRTARVLPFEQSVVSAELSAEDRVIAMAERLATVGGGGTNVSAPLAQLNRERATGNLIVIVSDNESWVDADSGRGTATLREWNTFVGRNPGARLVLIDLQPYETTQALERDDILNIGGFSDQVFEVIAEFAAGRLNGEHWVGQIEAVSV